MQTNFFKLLFARGRTKFNLLLGAVLLTYTVLASLDPVLMEDFTAQVPPLYVGLAGAVGLLINWWYNVRDNLNWGRLLSDLPILIEMLISRVKDSTGKQEFFSADYDPVQDFVSTLKRHKLL